MTTPFFNSFNPSSSTSQVPFDIASVMQGLAHSDLPSLINDILGNLASAAQPQPQGEASADASASKTEGPVLTKTMIPRLDHSTTASTVTAVLDLPGFAKSDVSIAVQPGKIVVSAERAPSASTKGKEKEFEQPEEIKWEVRERPEGKWVRELPLAVGVKPDEIKASMANGVLTITYPKQAAAETIQQVQIQ